MASAILQQVLQRNLLPWTKPFLVFRRRFRALRCASAQVSVSAV